MTDAPSFTSTRPNRNPLRIVAVVTMSLALVGGFLLDVARQGQGQPQGTSEQRT
jgi:hypothetical protein